MFTKKRRADILKCIIQSKFTNKRLAINRPNSDQRLVALAFVCFTVFLSNVLHSRFTLESPVPTKSIKNWYFIPYLGANSPTCLVKGMRFGKCMQYACNEWLNQPSITLTQLCIINKQLLSFFALFNLTLVRTDYRFLVLFPQIKWIDWVWREKVLSTQLSLFHSNSNKRVIRASHTCSTK